MISTNVHNVKSVEVWTNKHFKANEESPAYTITRIWIKTHDKQSFDIHLFSDEPITFTREDFRTA